MNRFSVAKLPSDYLREIAENHKKLRKSLKISQAELAMRSGVSLGTIKRFENSGQIALESLLKLALLLNALHDFDNIFKREVNLEAIEKLFSSKIK